MRLLTSFFYYDIVVHIYNCKTYVHSCRYGVGYHMTIVKKTDCDSSKLISLVKSMVESAQQVTDVGAELTFILPSNATPTFPNLFDTLEGRCKTIILHIIYVYLLLVTLPKTNSIHEKAVVRLHEHFIPYCTLVIAVSIYL